MEKTPKTSVASKALPAVARFKVLKAVTDDGTGQTYMPGDVIENSVAWGRKLEEDGYVREMKPRGGDDVD